MMIRVRPITKSLEKARLPRASDMTCAQENRAMFPGLIRSTRRLAAVLAVGSVLAVGGLPASNALAQDGNLSRQVEQLREDLDLLQRYVYREGVPEGAAPSADGGASTPAAARQQVQINDLQRTTTQLTGQIEQFDFRIRQMEDRLERLVADIDFRLGQLEGGAAGAGSASEAGNGQTPAGNAGATAAPSGQTSPAAGAANGSGEQLDENGTRLFGVIEGEGQAPQIPAGPSGSAGNSASEQANNTSASATPEDQYRDAFALLRRQEFGAAESALSQFVEQHPDDPLAGNAQYWLGETYYVRGQFENAAIAFTEGFQTYPDSSKAPDNLLKLGMSLANLGNNEDACTTFAHLIDNFPDASSVVLDRARQERQNRGCTQ
ncbi:tol-pal system protein YbgF [Thalassospira sp. MA62]|nr:tol-pal system protein YbgF [Thalassospira sp. MA62]